MARDRKEWEVVDMDKQSQALEYREDEGQSEVLKPVAMARDRKEWVADNMEKQSQALEIGNGEKNIKTLEAEDMKDTSFTGDWGLG